MMSPQQTEEQAREPPINRTAEYKLRDVKSTLSIQDWLITGRTQPGYLEPRKRLLVDSKDCNQH